MWNKKTWLEREAILWGNTTDNVWFHFMISKIKELKRRNKSMKELSKVQGVVQKSKLDELLEMFDNLPDGHFKNGIENEMEKIREINNKQKKIKESNNG